tara:strand:+ start:8560 stop:9132 length:573 start_codon:yes stop_codon:yes gene_type:complete
VASKPVHRALMGNTQKRGGAALALNALLRTYQGLHVMQENNCPLIFLLLKAFSTQVPLHTRHTLTWNAFAQTDMHASLAHQGRLNKTLLACLVKWAHINLISNQQAVLHVEGHLQRYRREASNLRNACAEKDSNEVEASAIPFRHDPFALSPQAFHPIRRVFLEPNAANLSPRWSRQPCLSPRRLKVGLP